MKRQTPSILQENHGALTDNADAPWCQTTMAGFIGATFETTANDVAQHPWTFSCFHDEDTGDVYVKVVRPASATGPMTVHVTLVHDKSSDADDIHASEIVSDELDATTVRITHMSTLMESQQAYISPTTGKFDLKLTVFLASADDVNPAKRMRTDDVGSSPTSVKAQGSPTGFDSAMESELSLLNDDPLDLDKPSLIDLTMNINYDSKQATGMVGLKNQGATCYMNSLLQTLFYLRPFRKAVYDTPTADDDSTNSVALALQRVFYRLQTADKAVSTKELTKAFGWSHMDAFTQHDVQELYRILCDRLEEKMKTTPVDGLIPSLFEGKVNSFVSCVHVDCTSSREESFYDLQLDVKGCVNLDASFEKFVEVEMLDGDNQYDAKGFGKQDAKKGLSFKSFPPILNIQLKRFEYDPLRDGMVKVHDRFEFSKELNLKAYMQDTTAPSTYHLHSILVHSGDVHGGHYYVYIRSQVSFQEGGSLWYKFDDDVISSIEEASVMESSFGSKQAGSSSFSSAYMLVYVQAGSWNDCAIPASLRDRFQAEEVATRRRKRLAQREQLYMHLRIVTDDAVGKLRRITRTQDFAFLPKSNKNAQSLVKLKVLKTNTIRQLYGQLHVETGLPINGMRLWKMATRENQTTRPDEPLDNHDLDVTCAQLLEEDPSTKVVWLFVEVLLPDTDNVFDIKKATMQDYVPELTSPFVPDDDDDETPPQLHPLAIEAATLREAHPLPLHTMLLFVKSYDPYTMPLTDRLVYVGNMLVTHDSVVSDVVRMLQEHIEYPGPLDLYEEVQPESINLLDPTSTLIDCELQHGDMLICQVVPPELDDDDEVDDDATYPTVPSYFEYLLNRVDVTFHSVHDESTTIVLSLLWTTSFEQVVASLAAHVRTTVSHLRFFKHSSLHNGPQSVPLKYARYAGDPHTTLRGILSDFGGEPRYATLYFEILPVSIVEMERKVKWTLLLSPFEPAFQGHDKTELLLDPTTTVADALAQVAATLHCPHPLKLLETRDRSTMLGFVSPMATVNNVPCSSSSPLLVDSVPQSDDVASASVGVVGVMQFYYHGDEWITTHSTPCAIELFAEDTFQSVRARLQRRMQVADDVFGKWRLAAIFENKGIRLEDEPGDKDQDRVVDWLEKLNLNVQKECFLGLEHTPPKANDRHRRHEQGIKIRSS
ncbi:Aste57867_14596 [Aphanomyces stellatus]|uniref:ubiquitinyl hydrolase 1 n=1 Tax=Aphanomyces stellatus TaxID=120398 RepID=A0A485L143_9STRA|nr:hypothetical protein As57867_014542 [Aphanomyces stellatus]VFT91415.1 Aste57867_14596 [Aphanomyces stellatus]